MHLLKSQQISIPLQSCSGSIVVQNSHFSWSNPFLMDQVLRYISFSYLFLSLSESEICRSVEVKWVANVILCWLQPRVLATTERSEVALNGEVGKFRESAVWIHKACSRFEMYPKAPSVESYHPRSESYHPYLGVRAVSWSGQGVLCQSHDQYWSFTVTPQELLHLDSPLE